MISNGSMLRSTPPTTAASVNSSLSEPHAVITASRDDEHAPSTVKHPPLKSNWLQIRPAMVLDKPPARVSSSTGGKELLYLVSISARKPASLSSSQPISFSAEPSVRRTYGQRSRIRLALVNSPVRLLPTMTQVPVLGSPSPSGKPASASARAAVSSASQCVMSVVRNVLPAILYFTRSNSNPSMTA